MIVEHPARPQWGPGKVMAVAEGRVHVVFRDELEPKAKAIMTEMVPLNVAAEQTDGVLDLLPAATELAGSWMLPKNYERLLNRASAEGGAEKATGRRGPRAVKNAAR
jgi:hypothetical protein